MRQFVFVPLLALTLSGFPASPDALTPEPALRPGTAAAVAPANGQPPLEIPVHRRLALARRLLAVDDPATAFEATNEIPALQEESDPSAVEARLGLDRPARRLIQQELRNEGFDPGTPDGLFGPRTRAAIRRWQEARGEQPTGYLTAAEVQALRTAGPAVPSQTDPVATAAPAGAAPPAIANAMRPDCEQWNTEEFFETATTTSVAACLAAGANLAARDDNRNTPLHWAASHSQTPAVIDALLAAGAELEARNRQYDETPLHLAASLNENPAVLETLLAAGADLDGRTNQGATALHQAAAFNSNPTVIESLLAAGADLNARINDGRTALHVAAQFNANPAVLEALIEAGADHATRYGPGHTPLHTAAANSENPAVIAALLSAGADIGARANDGRTALHRAAASNENPAVTETLLAAERISKTAPMMVGRLCTSRPGPTRTRPSPGAYWLPARILARQPMMDGRLCTRRLSATTWPWWRLSWLLEPTGRLAMSRG